ncbi:MAG: response regulator [Paracoccaceae bacterium]|nr:MAG: response regulator [Paracoccaceae bacterium]
MTRPPAGPIDTEALHDEIARQAEFLREETPVRAVATLLAYGMTTIYLPLPFVATLLVLDLAGEVMSQRLMRDPAAMVRDPWRRRVILAVVFWIETCFALPAAVVWHVDDPYAKALSLGLLSGSMMHMATVRAIHLPHGLAGAAALALLIFGSNVVYWLPRGDWSALALTSLCGVVAVGYFVSAMLSNHRLHRDMAAGRRAALEADAAKGRFLARMSHELRTPLNGILGLAHAELRLSRDPEQRDRLGALLASAEGLATILNDSMDDAVVRVGDMPVRPRAAEPAAVLAASVALFRPRAAEAGLSLDLEIGPGLDRPAMIDSHRLQQCLSNLLSNALRHTARGGVKVTASRRSQAATGSDVLDIIVSDSGPGVAPDLRGRLFDSQAPSGGPGTGRRGLGLIIVRDLARRMGGDLALLPPSDTWSGARFHLSLALPDAPEVAPPPAPSGTELAGLRALVVDDLATNRLVALSCLRLLGAEAAEAAGGEAALSHLERSQVDVVLLDMNMPGMSGAETCAAIRALAAPGPRPAIVAMTADALPQDRARHMAAGLDGYLVKPVTPDSIAAALTPFLRRHAAGKRDPG